MSDTGATPQRDVNKIIKEVIKIWEKFGFKDMSLWETFQYNFEGFMEEDFKSASIYYQRKLQDYLQKYGVWVQKQRKYTIDKFLHNVILEEKPISWTEAEITSQKSRALIPTSLTEPPAQPAATLSTPAPFASQLSTPSPSGQAPANTLIYSMQPPGTGATPGAYMQPPSKGFPTPTYKPPGTGPSPGAYLQPLGIRYTPASHATPAPYATPRDYMRSPEPLQAAYT